MTSICPAAQTAPDFCIPCFLSLKETNFSPELPMASFEISLWLHLKYVYIFVYFFQPISCHRSSRIIKAGSDFRRSFWPDQLSVQSSTDFKLKQVAHGLFQLSFEALQQWRLHSLSGPCSSAQPISLPWIFSLYPKGTSLLATCDLCISSLSQRYHKGRSFLKVTTEV